MTKIENALVPITDTGCRIRALTPEQVLAEIEQHVSDICRAKLLLCALLRRVQDEGWYREWGYPSFRAFLKDKLKMSAKTAQVLVRIDRILIDQSGIGCEDVYEIGFAGAMELLPLARCGKITNENRSEVIQQAKTLTVDKLRAYVRAELNPGKADSGSAEGEDIPEPCMCGRRDGKILLEFTLTNNQWATISRALERAQDVIGAMSPLQLLVAISTDYLIRNDDRDVRAFSSSAEPNGSGQNTQHKVSPEPQAGTGVASCESDELVSDKLAKRKKEGRHTASTKRTRAGKEKGEAAFVTGE